MTSFDDLYGRAKAVLQPRRLSSNCEVGGVSAALVSESGQVYVGVCIDVPCSIGFCAEHAAAATMITNRESGKVLKMVAVRWDGSILPPCGRCRELVSQLHDDNFDQTEILVAKGVSEERCLFRISHLAKKVS